MRRDDSYRGFETWFNDFKMRIKMYWVLTLILGAVQLLLFVVGVRTFLGDLDGHYFWSWVVARVWMLWQPDHVMTFHYAGTPYRMTAQELAAYLQPYIARYAAGMLVLFLVTCSVYLAVPLLVKWFRRRARKQAGPEFVRGSRLVDAETWNRLLKRSRMRADLPLGELRLPVSSEVKHVLTVGRPGVGKTVLLSHVIERLRERGDRGVIYDFKGDYTARFYDPERDLLFNPLDARCVGWNLFNDIATVMDVDALAASLIPPAYHADPFWNDAARGVFSGLLHHLYQTDQRDNPALWNALRSDVKDIAKWLKKARGGDRGHTYIQDASSKQALSVHSVVMQYAQPFEYLAGVDGDFSVVEWLRDREDRKGKGGREGWIFVTNYSDIQDTLRPILSLFIDLLGRKLLAMPDDPNRRVFFMLDEFGTLQRLSTIVKLLTLSRSKGGSVWVGIQDVGQIDKIYSKDLRQSIVNACGNSVLFSVADPDTSKFVSEKIGDTENLETEETYSMGPSEFRDGVSLARRRKKEILVLPSELKTLPDLTAYVEIGGFPVTRATLRYKDYPVRSAPFELREDLLVEQVVAKTRAAEMEESAEPTDPAPEDPSLPSVSGGKQNARLFNPTERSWSAQTLDWKRFQERGQRPRDREAEPEKAGERETREAAERQARNEEIHHDASPEKEAEQDEGRGLEPEGLDPTDGQ
ncbi:MAG: type IV secretion system DNA-binding domain-containing protein [Deferrisomatales bacterium]|nr:type IV secretion system DNA-binding domain-containing protein [Deferrisomatales bacterium]